jgi:hypothetical protein
MDCHNVQEKLNLYMEHLLSSQEEKSLRDHITNCPDCAGALQELEDTISILKNLDRVQPPPWLSAKIMAHIEDEAGNRRSILSWIFRPLTIKIPLQALALVCVVGLSVLLYRANISEFEQTEPPKNRGAEKTVPHAAPGAPHRPMTTDMEKHSVTTNTTPEVHRKVDQPEKHWLREIKSNEVAPLIKQEVPAPEYDKQPSSEAMKSAVPAPAPSVAPAPAKAAPETAPLPPASTGRGPALKKESRIGKPTGFNDMLETKSAITESIQQKDKRDMSKEGSTPQVPKAGIVASDTITMVEKILKSLEGKVLAKTPGPSGTIITAQLPTSHFDVLIEKLSTNRNVRILPDKPAQPVDPGISQLTIEITNP